MDLRVFASPEEAGHALAGRVAEAVREKPALVLGLATGRSPVIAYQQLQRLHAQGQADFSRARTFNLDEFVGVDASHPGSFRRFMDEHLFRGLNIPLSHIGFLNGSALDLDDECERYEAAIETAGGIDLQLLGIGVNGHVGFNEPGDQLAARTHRARLLDATRRENAPLFDGEIGRVPREALSMGMGTILKAAAIALVATGERKAACVRRMIRGPLTTRFPASFLQTHRAVEVFLDRTAASLL